MTAPPAHTSAGVGPILKRVLGNAGLLLGGRTVNALLGLAYLAVTARALGAASLGVLVLIHAFAQFLGEVVKFQSWQTIIHYGARPLAEGRRGEVQRVIRFTLVLDAASTVLGVGLGVAGALAFGDRLGWADEGPAAAGYMLTIAFMVSATPLGLLRLFDRFDLLALQTALVALVRLGGSLLAWWAGAGLQGFLLAWAAGALAGYAILLGGALFELKKRDLLQGWRWDGRLDEGLPGVWRFAWNTNLSATLDVAFTHVATLMVGALVGPAQAAFWRVGRQVADAMAKPARLLTPALYPELARLRAERRENAMWRLARHVALLAGGVGLVLLAMAAFAGPLLLSAILGREFAPAASVMTWQVAAAVIGIFALPLEPMLISLGKPGAAVRVRLAVSLCYLAALPFLVEAFGLTGAGAGLAAAAGALALGMLWFILRENGNRRPDAPEPAAVLDDPKGDD